MTIVLLWPTARPKMMRGTHIQWVSMSVRPENIRVVVAVNTDAERSELAGFRDVTVCGSSRRGAAYPVWRLTSVLSASGDDVVIVASDDIYPRRGWDEWIMSQFEGHAGAVMVDDGNPRVPHMHIPCLRFGAVLRLNRILYHPAYRHSYADVELYDNLAELGLIKDSREAGCMFEHRHPALGKRPGDQVDLFIRSAFGEDRRTYEIRRRLPLAERLMVRE